MEIKVFITQYLLCDFRNIIFKYLELLFNLIQNGLRSVFSQSELRMEKAALEGTPRRDWHMWVINTCVFFNSFHWFS